MYFDKFVNGGVAAMEPVSHIDILLSAQEAMQDTYEAEMALMEEEGGAYIQAMQFGSEGIGSAAAAIGEKAKELGSSILKKLEEFIRKVKAFISNFINSMRHGAIISTLKTTIAKAEKRLKASDSDWAQNAPDPKRVTKWNSEAATTVAKTLFVTKEAVDDLVKGTQRAMAKIQRAWSDRNAPMNADFDRTQDNPVREGGTGGLVGLDHIDEDLAGITYAMQRSSQRAVSGAANTGRASAPNAQITKWLGPIHEFEDAFEITDRRNNSEIARRAVQCASRIIASMHNDPVLQAYNVVQEIEKEVGAARSMAKDAGKNGTRAAKALKKLQNIVHKAGTTATLMARRQLGSWKVLASLNLRMFSIAGSKEREDYRED